MNVVQKIEELQALLEQEFSKPEPDMELVRKLRAQIIELGFLLTPLDIYNKRR